MVLLMRARWCRWQVPRLVLAEAGAAYNSLAVTGEEEPSQSLQWRKRSPNGLLPTASGLGIPRASPISQSGSILRFLGRQFGLAGSVSGTRLDRFQLIPMRGGYPAEIDACGCQTPTEEVAADVMYETAKDLGSNTKVVVEYEEGGEKAESAKMPWALALRLEKMLLLAPAPQEPSSALTYGQLQLFHTLTQMDRSKPGCVATLSEGLEVFRAATAARERVAAYLAGPLRYPATCGELGQEGGYNYATGPIARKDLTL